MFRDICHTSQNNRQNIHVDLQPVCSHVSHRPCHQVLTMTEILMTQNIAIIREQVMFDPVRYLIASDESEPSWLEP